MSASEMGNSSSNFGWQATYREIQTKHDLAYYTIEEAIKLEEQEKPLEALEKYKDGISRIDETLNIHVTCPERPDLTWEKACVMIQKMKKTRAEVLMRINSMQTSNNFRNDPPEDPPSYDEAMSSTSSGGDALITYKDLATALHELQIDPNSNRNIDAEILYTHSNVKLYFISPDGQVTSTSEAQQLKITLVTDEQRENTPRAILQVGDWVYPLVPGVSPCYRTNYGAFILPNVYAQPGSSVGIILPPEADEDVYDLLENILHGIVSAESKEDVLRRVPEEELSSGEDVSQKISSKIINGAWYLSQGLVRGAEKASEFFDSSTPKIINSIQPAERPANIPRKISRGMEIAENTTGKAVQITGYVADKVGLATMKLGHFLAPHIQKQGTRLLTTGFNMSEQEASKKVSGVLTVAAGAVEGFSTVYRGLESSASILGNNLKNNTVKVVQHKYGVQAGELTGDTFSTVGNVITINHNTKILKPTGLAKRAAKDAGRAVVAGYSASSVNNPGPSTENKIALKDLELEKN